MPQPFPLFLFREREIFEEEILERKKRQRQLEAALPSPQGS